MKKYLLNLAVAIALLAPVAALAAGATTGAGAVAGQYCRKQVDATHKLCTIADSSGACPDSSWSGPTADSCKCSEVNPSGNYNPGDECVQLDNPIQSGITDVPGLIGVVIKAALGLMGALTLYVFFKGTEKIVTAAGNSEKVSEGAAAIFWAATGFIAVLLSYIFLNNVIIPYLTGTGIGAVVQ